MSLLYKILCVMRVYLVLGPQIGYIHPDEHFQGPEIVYGDVLQYDVNKPWEFTSSKPIRSIVFPYFISVIPAAILRCSSYFGFKPDAYLLIIFPRLFMCLLSFVQDLCIYKICMLLNLKHESSLLFLGSSYVTLVYSNRTFSNSLESLYFAVLLILVIKVLKLKDIVNNKSKMEILKRFLLLSFVSGIVNAIGLFNRPTFICFACLPMIVMTYMIFKLNFLYKAYTFTALMLGGLSTIACLTIIDSVYYSEINSLSEFRLDAITFTPLHFLAYNSNPVNLATHGLHSRWIHILVNIPLLFSIFGIVLPIYSLKNCFSFISQYKLSFELLFFVSFIVPLVVFSFIPHQEPRFLVPLIIPLSLLFSFHQFKKYSVMTFVWVITNFLCYNFYASLHQGGVYSSIEYLRSENINNSMLMFHKTYMPPQYLLSIEKSQNTKVIDFAGCSIGHFNSEIKKHVADCNPMNLYLVFPSLLIEDYKGFQNLYELDYEQVKGALIFPHFSTEIMLNYLEKIKNIALNKYPLFTKIDQLKQIFGIEVIKFRKR